MMLSGRKKTNIFLFILIALYIIVYRFFIYKNFLGYAESITASFSIILLTISITLLGFRKTIKNKLNTKSIKSILFFIILYFLFIYGLGISTGFLSNSYSRNLTSIISNVFSVTITIISIELFRYTFISSNKDKRILIYIMTILLSIFEINLFIKYDTFDGIENIFRFVALIMLPELMKGTMCSYFTYQTDYKASLIYRLILELYIYIVPFEPDLGEWATSIFKIALPFVIVLDFQRIVYNYNKSIEHSFSRNNLRKSDIPFVIVTIVLVLLVFGIGPYKMIGIETGSMTPSLNIGDAVIISKNYNKEELKEEDIIAYKDSSDTLVVHRIIKVNSDGTFITKGDYNNVADTLYVNKDQVFGKVSLRIPYIAYPAKWFK